MILKSPALRYLNLTCNPLNVDGGHKLLDGVRNSPRLLKVDVRLTGCGRDVDMAMQDALKKNKFARGPPHTSTSSSSSPSTDTSTKKFNFSK
jgi:hypothetical protein